MPRRGQGSFWHWADWISEVGLTPKGVQSAGEKDEG